MMRMKIKQISIKILRLNIGYPFESLYLEKKKHYPLTILVLNVLYF